ncbi:MAG: 1-aminocyclopropane-1-carboxylate deaminase/D-cysteine desulfhydrase, partial [Chitinophagaceae bacterium]
MSFQLQNCRIDSLFSTLGFPLDVLRLDLIHPVISGNKWFKLKGYLQQAKEENKDILLTWGGAYSNHIVASAYAAKLAGLKSIGIIRGEEPRTWSHTLLAAKAYGMQLYFLSREEYWQKSLPQEIIETIDCDEVIEIPEGGYGEKGAEGASEILTLVAPANYTHIVSAVGTGTTLAGLCLSALDQQRTIGIPVLKNA